MEAWNEASWNGGLGTRPAGMEAWNEASREWRPGMEATEAWECSQLEWRPRRPGMEAQVMQFNVTGNC